MGVPTQGAVYFGSAPGTTHHCRVPRFLGWLIRVLSRSPLDHCAIGCDGWVLNVSYRLGNRYWPADAYEEHYPGLVCVWTVPLVRPIDWQRQPMPGTPGRRRVLPLLCRWLTRGRCPGVRKATDCVGIAVDLLTAAGLAIPRRIVSPGELHEWLARQGYRHQVLRTGAACHA